MEDSAEISFSVRERFGKDKRPTVVERRVALQIESGAALENRYWQRSASLHVKAALERFDSVGEDLVQSLVVEAESMPDILNLNAGMLAGAQVFYQRSMNTFSKRLFESLSPDILRVLVDFNLLTGSSATSSGKRTEADDPQRYAMDLFRYIGRLGIFRGIIPSLSSLARA